MKHHRTKIPSFTLSEMIVALAVTTIVVAMAFTVLGLVQRQLQGIATNFSGETELELLEQSLWIDFNRYQDIRYLPQTDEIKCRTELDSVSYVLYADKIVKLTDTFAIAFRAKTFFMDGREVSGGRIDALYFQTAPDSMANKKLFIRKENDAAQYME
ncbi:hypothetical protein SAMN02927921_00606 [Sinomicrobium oceani]|uniref:Prepilin-type N-terminal cleavage/methylation domain-containing protein n=1 Tax=Sinomicrobium oceani TaxID=1150368 RepID=A0A1K1ME80_9FLAO|nr:prepilin-type N-terminal cleavage/methylation domain-containing protein [Sinomicrobium oceani]SFW21445.1 hypothetical protein SAMN02927921_00606 [Sinomicrobium oceani]